MGLAARARDPKEAVPALVASKATPRELVEAGALFVSHALAYHGVPYADVNDAAQDVFVVALRRLPEFEGRASLRSWLYGICVHVAQSYRRRAIRARREAPTEDLPEVVVPALQEAAIERSESERRLSEVLHALDEGQRMAFVLYEIEELSMQEVADALGCQLKTAYYRHQVARRRVLEAFKTARAKGEA